MNRAAFFSALVGLAALLWIAAAPQAQAHNRSQSYSTWNVSDGTVELLFTVKAREVTRLPPLEGNLLTLEALLAAHLGETIRVSSNDGTACVAKDGPQALTAAEGYLRMRAIFDCRAAPASTVQLDSFFSMAPSHVHYARVLTDGELPAEYLFTDGRREHAIAGVGGRFDNLYKGFLQYLLLGVEHILGGVDHLAFLAALLLLVRSFRELAWIVTGFTVGHSITLSLAVLGHLSLEMWIIEALIGFTVALVAADNIGVTSGRRAPVALVTAAILLAMAIVSALWGVGLPLLTLAGLGLFTAAYMAISTSQSQARGMRPSLTLAFGMIHGFGFANVLNEIGLPDERMAVALAGFNIGVELGQLAVVALLWWLVRWYGQRSADWNYQPWFDTASAGLCGLGMFWFISRGFVQV
jgi:hypothetical protein